MTAKLFSKQEKVTGKHTLQLDEGMSDGCAGSGDPAPEAGPH